VLLSDLRFVAWCGLFFGAISTQTRGVHRNRGVHSVLNCI